MTQKYSQPAQSGAGYGPYMDSDRGYCTLTDGTEIWVEQDSSGYVKLFYSSDHITPNLIINLGTLPAAVSMPNAISICTDNLDNIYFHYVTYSGTVVYNKFALFTKGAGYTWTSGSYYTGNAGLNWASSYCDVIPIVWLNTGGGTNGKGHLMTSLSVSSATSTANALTIWDAGGLAGAGSTSWPYINSYSQPACFPAVEGATGNEIGSSYDVCCDGFGNPEGLIISSGQPGAGGSSNVYVGHFVVSSAGALTTNANIKTYSFSTAIATRVRLLRVASGAFVFIMASTANPGTRIQASKLSLTAETIAPVELVTPAGMTAPANSSPIWDAIFDSADVKVYVYTAHSTTANAIARVGLTYGASLVWDSAVTVDDTAVGNGTTSTNTHPRCPNLHGRGPLYGSYQFNNQETAPSGLGFLVGDYTLFNLPPNPPTLGNPVNGSIIDLAAGTTFYWTFSDPNTGDTQSAWAFRIKTSGGTYQYWNAGTSTLQSTIVWNSGAAQSVAIPAAILLDNNTVYNWSAASQDNHSAQGPFAADSTVTGSSAPAVSITTPTGSATVAQPIVNWTFSPGSSGDTQSTYQVEVESGAFGVVPGSGTAVWNSTEVTDINARSRQIGVALTNGVTYRTFVRVKESNSLYSNWTYQNFTTAFDPPATPVVSTAFDSILNRVLVSVQGEDNLLTLNQSSLESGNTTGWAVGSNATLAATASQALDGAYSLQMTSVAAGDMFAQTGGGNTGFPVLPSTVYSVVASLRASTVIRQVQVGFNWYDVNGTFISTSPLSALVNDSTTTWVGPAGGVGGQPTSPSNAAFGQALVFVRATGAAGEVHYVDAIGVMPGVVNAWTRGGITGSQSVAVQFSDDSGTTWKYVRGAASLTPGTISQLSTIYDYEAKPGAPRQYRAQTSGSGVISNWSAGASVTPTPVPSFWLKDPTVPANNMIIKVDPPLPHGTPESQGLFQPLGAKYAVVIADRTIGGKVSKGLNIHCTSLAEYNSLTALMNAQRVLLLQSPFGDQWYIRIGQERHVEHHGPDAADPLNQYYKVGFGYVEQPMPATP